MKKKRSKREKIERIQQVFEERGQFNRETIPYGNNWTVPDKNYKYRQPWYELVETYFWRCALASFGTILTKFYGARVVGKKNLKAIKKQGAISICNHFHYLDTLFVRRAIGNFNSFHTMGQWNNKKGIGGHIIRHGGMWPFSQNAEAMKNLNKEMQRQLEKGKIINFYPEQSMWWNYQKPRPMKDGAFHYAIKFNVPILPVFCTFKKSKKRGCIRSLRINILPPIFPDSNLTKREKLEQMKKAAEKSWQDCYGQYYQEKANG